MNLCLYIIIYTSQVQALANALVSILQVVLADETDVHFSGGIALLLEKIVPRFHGRRFAHGDAYFAQDGGIKALSLHVHRHLIDAGHIFALHHALQIDITERCHLQAHRVVKVAFCTENEYVGLDAHALQFLHRVLGGFCLQLVSCLQIRHIREVHTHRIPPQLPPQLSYGFHERRTLYVANRAADLGDDKSKDPPHRAPPQGGASCPRAFPLTGGVGGGSLSILLLISSVICGTT